MNAIWATTRRRSLAHRLALYWAFLTLAPLLLAAVLALNGRLIADLLSNNDLVWLQSVWFTLLPWLVGASALWIMFLLLPAVRVMPGHALAGAMVSATLLSVLQRVLGWGVQQLPTYEIVYGAFAVLPLLLIWLVLVWGAVLAGALLAASLRHWAAPLDEPEPDDSPGRRFDDALSVLSAMLTAGRSAPSASAFAPGGPGAVVATSSDWLAMSARCLRDELDRDVQRAEQAAELLERLGYVIRFVNLAGGTAAPGGALPETPKGAVISDDGIWAERWTWAKPPSELTLRPLFDHLWWAEQDAPRAAWQGNRLDCPIAQALAG